MTRCIYIYPIIAQVAILNSARAYGVDAIAITATTKKMADKNGGVTIHQLLGFELMAFDESTGASATEWTHPRHQYVK